jgi:hypothetical protein
VYSRPAVTVTCTVDPPEPDGAAPSRRVVKLQPVYRGCICPDVASEAVERRSLLQSREHSSQPTRLANLRASLIRCICAISNSARGTNVVTVSVRMCGNKAWHAMGLSLHAGTSRAWPVRP